MVAEKIRGDIEEAKTDIKGSSLEAFPETEMLKERLEWFQDMKLGVIMHWGLYSEAGIVESWQLSEEDEWAREPIAWRDDVKELQRDYWGLNKLFNPNKLDAKKWAKTCKEAGFNYLIYTTKHHDGFNMYDTAESDYKIGGKDSPYTGEDPLKLVFDAFREEGLATGAYYSKADWYSPYYWLDDDTVKGRRASYNPEEKPEIWEKYVGFVHNQIHEITHNYGKIDLLWLDAGWCGRGKEDLRMDEFAEIARDDNKELIIVDRMMGGRHENYVTPERKVPSIAEIPDKPWESNIPIGNDWGYNPNDTYKTSQELIETLVNVVSKGGNLILGLGPKPDGTFTEEEEKIMKELGSWLTIYGEGIYKTRPLEILDEDRAWFITQNKEAYYAFYTLTKSVPDHVDFESLGILQNDVESVISVSTNEQLKVCKDQIILPENISETLGCYGIKLKKKV